MSDRTFYLRLTGFGSDGVLHTIVSRTPPATWSDGGSTVLQCLMRVPASIRASVEVFEPYGKDAQLDFTLNCIPSLRTDYLGRLFSAAPQFITDEAGGVLRLAQALKKSDTELYCYDGDVDETDIDSEIWVDGECLLVTDKEEVEDRYPSTLMVTKLTVERGRYGTRVMHHGFAFTAAMASDVTRGLSQTGYVGPEIGLGPSGWHGQEIEFGAIDETGAESVLFVGILAEAPKMSGSPLMLNLTARSISSVLRSATFEPPKAWNARPPKPDFISQSSAVGSWDQFLLVSRDQYGTDVWEYATFCYGDKWVVLKLGERELVEAEFRAVQTSQSESATYVFASLYKYPLPTVTQGTLNAWPPLVQAYGEKDTIHGFGAAMFTADGEEQSYTINPVWSTAGEDVIDNGEFIRDVLQNADRVEYAMKLTANTVIGDFVGDDYPAGCCLGFDTSKYIGFPADQSRQFNGVYENTIFFPASHRGKKLGDDILAPLYKSVAAGIVSNSNGKIGVLRWGVFNRNVIPSPVTAASSDSWDLTPGVTDGPEYFAPRVVVRMRGFEQEVENFFTSSQLPAAFAFTSPLEVNVPFYAKQGGFEWGSVVANYPFGGMTYQRQFMDASIEVGDAIEVAHADVCGPTGALGGTLIGQVISVDRNFETRQRTVVVFVQNWNQHGDQRKGWAASGKVVSWNAGTKVLTIEANYFTNSADTPNRDSAAFDFGVDFGVWLVDKHFTVRDTNTLTDVGVNTLTMQNAFTVTPGVSDFIIFAAFNSQEYAAASLTGYNATAGFAPAFLADDGASIAQDTDGTEHQVGRYG